MAFCEPGDRIKSQVTDSVSHVSRSASWIGRSLAPGPYLLFTQVVPFGGIGIQGGT